MYIIAKNWLADLYGILHNNGYSNTDKNSDELNKQIIGLKEDKRSRDNNRTSDTSPEIDEHLKFVLSKYACKVNICTYIV